MLKKSVLCVTKYFSNDCYRQPQGYQTASKTLQLTNKTCSIDKLMNIQFKNNSC